MRLDLRQRAELAADAGLEAVRHLMRLSERQAPFHLEIERQRKPPLGQPLHGDVMHRDALAQRHQQHAVPHRLVAWRHRHGLHRDIGILEHATAAAVALLSTSATCSNPSVRGTSMIASTKCRRPTERSRTFLTREHAGERRPSARRSVERTPSGARSTSAFTVWTRSRIASTAMIAATPSAAASVAPFEAERDQPEAEEDCERREHV